MSAAERFVAAFNARDLEALADCVAPDATARVDGAPFPTEEGRQAIRDTSFAYLLGIDPPLRAQRVDHPEAALLLLDGQGRIDMAVRIEEVDSFARTIRYYTLPHRPLVVTAIADALGLPVADA